MINLANGVKIEQALFGQYPIILASNQGYGFITDTKGLDTSQKAGKAVVNLGLAHLLAFVAVGSATHIAVVSSGGNLLVFDRDELPILAKGKGNKLMNLKDNETLVAVSALTDTDNLIIHTNKRTLTLKPNDWANYKGKRSGRGRALPKGFLNVVGMDAKRADE